ncbi:MAG: hypothetical protein KKG14_12680 [Alphaproteobacteria bacterium]|nr:hypothetical protein [Alphaproteobacteria bacterium]MBU2272003.1 hypothetical protein [Alphaproteobacteria bacterium]MBU2419548.1 hypothetical protein [Alphaproteobacteria bacterium]
MGTDAMTAGESSDCGKPISISNRYCVASHNAYYAREINMLAGFSIFSNSDLPRAANDEMHAVLSRFLARSKSDDPAAGVVRTWWQRDPVDAALDARLLWQRLRRDGANVSMAPPVRHAVIRLQQDWTRRFPAAVYLLAAERLSQVMDAWADAELASVIAGGAPTPSSTTTP